MAAKPKLPPDIRSEIANLTSRRDALTRMILKLQWERRQLPKPGQLAKKHGVSHRTIARICRGDPYRV